MDEDNIMYVMNCLDGKLMVGSKVLADISFSIEISYNEDGVVPHKMGVVGLITSYKFKDNVYALGGLFTLCGRATHGRGICDLKLRNCHVVDCSIPEQTNSEIVICFINFKMLNPNNDLKCTWVGE